MPYCSSALSGNSPPFAYNLVARSNPKVEAARPFVQLRLDGDARTVARMLHDRLLYAGSITVGIVVPVGLVLYVFWTFLW